MHTRALALRQAHVCTHTFDDIAHADARAMQNDPSVPEGAGPKLDADTAQALHESNAQQQDGAGTGGSGPKAAGQGVVEGMGGKDPERYGSDRAGPA